MSASRAAVVSATTTRMRRSRSARAAPTCALTASPIWDWNWPATALAETTQRLELLIGERIRNEALQRTDAITAAIGAAAEGRRTELEELRRSIAGQFQSQIGEAVNAQVGAARAELERRMRVVVADTTAALEADITDLRRRIR